MVVRTPSALRSTQQRRRKRGQSRAGGKLNLVVFGDSPTTVFGRRARRSPGLLQNAALGKTSICLWKEWLPSKRRREQFCAGDKLDLTDVGEDLQVNLQDSNSTLRKASAYYCPAGRGDSPMALGSPCSQMRRVREGPAPTGLDCCVGVGFAVQVRLHIRTKLRLTVTHSGAQLPSMSLTLGLWSHLRIPVARTSSVLAWHTAHLVSWQG